MADDVPQALESAQSNVTALQANLAAQQAQLAGIRLSLEYATIRAPISGIVSARNVDPGQTVGAGTTVATIVDLSEMEARVLAPLSAASALAVGKVAELSVEGIAGRLFEAEISRMNPVAVEGTRSIPIYITVPNADRSLKGGMFAQGELVLTSTQPVLSVATRAVHDDAGAKYVYTLHEGKIARTPVALGAALEGSAYVEVRDGLSAGDRVIVANLGQLKPGATAVVRGEGTAANGVESEVARR